MLPYGFHADPALSGSGHCFDNSALACILPASERGGLPRPKIRVITCLIDGRFRVGCRDCVTELSVCLIFRVKVALLCINLEIRGEEALVQDSQQLSQIGRSALWSRLDRFDDCRR